MLASWSVANLNQEAPRERELWPPLDHLVMEVGNTIRLADVTFQPHAIALVFLWAALPDRPVSWACTEANGRTTTVRPLTIPSQATLSRRRRRVDIARFLRSVIERIRRSGDPHVIAVIAGQPRPVGGGSEDPQARCGHGAAHWARGYKRFAAWDGRPVPAVDRVDPLNKNEHKVAEEMLGDLAGGGGSWLGEGEYDAHGVYDAAGAAGSQVLAPRADPEAGRGHHDQSPYRLRCLELMGTSFGQAAFHLRGDVEREFGHLTSFGGGLSPLPSWVRHEKRVWLWVTAKLLINAMRIMRRKGLAA